MDTPLKTGEIHPLFFYAKYSFLDYRDPYGFSLLLRLSDALYQASQPDTGVHHHALKLVLTNEDAALRVVGIIAGMDADALEIRHAQEQWQPTLESWRIR